MDSPHKIPNERLRQEHLPGPDDDQSAWIEFALTFDGYAEKGTHEACAAFANAARNRWKQSGTLPIGLNDLRTALFFEQRRWRWSKEGPFTEDEWRYWGSLVEAIRSELTHADRLPPEPHPMKNRIEGFSDAAIINTTGEEVTVEPDEVAGVRTTAETARVEPSAEEQVLDLYSETDTHGGTRHVWLRLTKEGNLILEGQDLGGAVAKFWGTSEYEWDWTLHPEQLDPFLESLGVKASGPADLLESVAVALKALDRTKIQKMFEAAGASFWSRSGD